LVQHHLTFPSLISANPDCAPALLKPGSPEYRKQPGPKLVHFMVFSLVIAKSP
jgi:hypothetical protein